MAEQLFLYTKTSTVYPTIILSDDWTKMLDASGTIVEVIKGNPVYL